MTLAASRHAILLLVLGAVGCGAAAGEAGPAQDHQSAFRSIGPSRIPRPGPPPTPGYVGSHTAYYSNGRPQAHGTYIRRGAAAVPHGVWTFWLADGSRQSQGRFHMGDPVGCFASWTPEGHRVTGFASGGEIQPASCEPPRHEVADILESSHGGAAQPPVDLSFQTLISPGADLGVESTRYRTGDPGMTWAVSAMWRRRVGPMRFGGALGLRAGEYDYLAVPVTLVGGWGRQMTTWLGLELWGEIGATVYRAQPQLENYAVAVEYFWTPVAAVQAEASWRIAGRLELSVAGRAELAIPRDVERSTLICFRLCGMETDTWSLGGFTPGLVIGLRFLVW